jgi:hypothetical protein
MALAAAWLLAGPAPVAAIDDFDNFVLLCGSGNMNLQGACGGGFEAVDCNACSLAISLDGACNAYCCAGGQGSAYCDGDPLTGYCTCNPCQYGEEENCPHYEG